MRRKGQCFIMFHQVQTLAIHQVQTLAIRAMYTDSSLKEGSLIQSREQLSCRRLSADSINLLVVYRESVNLIGYITRRLSADSLQL